jgi:Mg2+-importing ATPase
VGVFLPEGPLAHYFKMQSLPPLYFAVLPLIVFGYMATTQLMKRVYR